MWMGCVDFAPNSHTDFQVLATLVQRFKFELVDHNVEAENFLTFKPKNALFRVYTRAWIWLQAQIQDENIDFQFMMLL